MCAVELSVELPPLAPPVLLTSAVLVSTAVVLVVVGSP